jgi:hypothetical protein
MSPTEPSREVIDWTGRIIAACGTRLAGTEGSLKAAGLIADDLKKSCDRVEIQEFSCRPSAFIWHLSAMGMVFLVGCALLFWGFTAVAAVIFWVVTAIAVLEFGLYRELVDPLFPKRRCTNVLGVIEPAGPVVRQLVLGGHHDTAYEFQYLLISRYLYVIVAAWYVVSSYAMPLFASGALIAQLAGSPIPSWLVRAVALFAGSSALAGMGFFRRHSVPGAGDNLASCGIVVHAAARLRDQLEQNPEMLAGTRVIFASFDGEESGLRGSRAFVRANQALLAAAPTAVVNLESFYVLKELAALRVDLNGFVPLSARLADMAVEEGRAEGIEVGSMKMLYGLGATDAAEFARAGIAATTLLAVPHDFFGKGRVVYHTRHDTAENLDPATIDAAVRLTMRMIARVCREPPDSLASAA